MKGPGRAAGGGVTYYRARDVWREGVGTTRTEASVVIYSVGVDDAASRGESDVGDRLCVVGAVRQVLRCVTRLRSNDGTSKGKVKNDRSMYRAGTREGRDRGSVPMVCR